MKILVTVKRVTDPDSKVKIKPDGTGIVTEGVEFKANPFDEIAVEEALRLVEKHKGEVVVVSIGPGDATKEIRTALAMGANRGILVDARDEDLDGLLTASILQKLFEKEKPDLIILGKQAVDGDSNQVGQILAYKLGLPQACFASKVVVEGNRATVTREVDGGLETLSVSLPAVITADLRLNEPRYASLPGIMKAKKKPIENLTLAALGLAGVKPKIKMLRFETPPARKGGRKVGSVEELVALLKSEAKVI
ncbi:MAG: electron transfer flavoprotein subunit beta/FixA family protein [Deltaproteobacteria bacterium]|nr:electron transfer flavoprotein subunit beta/FixA family protein [Deltaproteobacteria bacterium]